MKSYNTTIPTASASFSAAGSESKATSTATQGRQVPFPREKEPKAGGSSRGPDLAVASAGKTYTARVSPPFSIKAGAPAAYMTARSVDSNPASLGQETELANWGCSLLLKQLWHSVSCPGWGRCLSTGAVIGEREK